jgi:hypothetical protein
LAIVVRGSFSTSSDLLQAEVVSITAKNINTYFINSLFIFFHLSILVILSNLSLKSFRIFKAKKSTAVVAALF